MISPAGNSHDGTFTGEFVDEMYNLKYRIDDRKLCRHLFGAGSPEDEEAWQKLHDKIHQLENDYKIKVSVNMETSKVTVTPQYTISDTQKCTHHRKCRMSCPYRIDCDGSMIA